MSKAFQQMLERCKTKYFVEVDEDMILFPNAIEEMYNNIEKTDQQIAMLVYLLKDIHLDFDLYGIKIYKYNILKKYPYNLECLSCEVEQLERLTNDGYKHEGMTKIMGNHSPKWNNNSIFERYFNLMEKFKEYKYKWLETLPSKLWEILHKSPTEKNLYALLGACSSITKEGIQNKEKDFTLSKLPEYSMLRSFLKFPTFSTIYMTSKCNYKCEWCYRQHHLIEEAPDMTIDKVKKLLSLYPSIVGVCVCGFGETFMSPNLKQIIKFLKEKNIFVGLITNGSLLETKLPEMLIDKMFLPNYISISLNAPNKTVHKEITKTDTFDSVLRGIKMCVNAKLETYVSYVCTKKNLNHIPEFLKVVKSLGVKTVYLHNILPHFKEEENDKFWELVLQQGDEHLFDEIKKLPESDIVKLYPVFINKNEIRRECRFPWDSIAINGNESISICNSVYPCDASNGTLKDYSVWQNNYCKDFRNSILTEQKYACRKCFRNWQISE